jgi:membrane protease YdiL (CAAX protease family)
LTAACPACGEQVAEGARFCRRCGSELELAELRQFLEPKPVEPVLEAVDERTLLRELVWLCSLPVGIAVVCAIVERIVGASALVDTIATLGIAAVAVTGAVKNRRLVQSELRLPRARDLVRTVLVALLAWPLLTLIFAALVSLGFAIYSGYLLPYLLAGWPIWTGYVDIAVVTPMSEELLFRGLIQPKLEQVLRPTEALVLQAVLFSAAHLSPVILVTHFLMGLAFGGLRRKSGSLFPSILLHGAWNAWVIWDSSR